MQSNYQQTAIASNATAASTNVIDELNCARALSALCGGSGVGQAPEPPHSAERRAEQLTVNRQQLTFLPKAPANLHVKVTSDRLDLHGLRADIHGYEVGEKKSVGQEEKIKKSFAGRVDVKRKKRELRELREIKGKLGEFRGILKDFRGNPRRVVRFAVSAASYACILIALVGFGFAYLPVIKAEVGYQWKNSVLSSQFSVVGKKLVSFQLFGFGTGKRETEKEGNVGAEGVEGSGGSLGNGDDKKAAAFPAPAETPIKNGSLESNIVSGKVAGAAVSASNAAQANAADASTNIQQLPETAPDEFANAKFVADFSISIPKIDAYAEIFPNVDPANYNEYMPVLQKGVAHARGTVLPGMVGNSYLFAHSAGNLLDIARFNAVFYLIGKLEKGDAIYVKFGNEKFKYTVLGKREVEPTDVKFLTGGTEAIREIGEMGEIGESDRVLTLQTCVPPGTDWRRLLVFAKIERGN